jgi:hypothetical protein
LLTRLVRQQYLPIEAIQQLDGLGPVLITCKKTEWTLS